jgi:hypothetical protein
MGVNLGVSLPEGKTGTFESKVLDITGRKNRIYKLNHKELHNFYS